MRIYSTANGGVRNASAIDNANSRMKAGSSIELRLVKKPRVCLKRGFCRRCSNGFVRVSTCFFSTIFELILRLRVPHLRWVLWLVWEKVAPGRLAGVVVRLLPLRLRNRHPQNFACTPKSVEKPTTHREGHIPDGLQTSITICPLFFKGGRTRRGQ